MTAPDKPTPGQIGHELRPEDGPFKVEVDDHSDDCGTVYRLFGPDIELLSKCVEELNNRGDDFNFGFAKGVSSQQAEIDRLKNENIDISLAFGMEKKAYELLEARIRELEAELEARKKAWETLKFRLTCFREYKGAVDEMTDLEATLPKGGA